MPKKTFYNLSREKKDRILDASSHEFSSNPYDLASINNIVKNADIAKGSFYQYFDNKEDLYRYVVSKCEEKKDDYMERALNRSEYMNVFDRIREIYKSMIRFSEENKRESLILDYIYKLEDEELKKELLSSSSNSDSSDIFERIVLDGVGGGEIRSTIDRELLISLLHNLNVFIKGYSESQGLLFDYERKIDDLIDILESGIKSKSRVSNTVEDRFY